MMMGRWGRLMMMTGRLGGGGDGGDGEPGGADDGDGEVGGAMTVMGR